MFFSLINNMKISCTVSLNESGETWNALDERILFKVLQQNAFRIK